MVTSASILPHSSFPFVLITFQTDVSNFSCYSNSSSFNSRELHRALAQEAAARWRLPRASRPPSCLSVCPSVCPSVRPSFSVSTEQPSLTLIAIIQGTCNSVSTRHCIRSSRSTVIVLLRFYPISYPCCISVLLYHIHSRQLVWKEIASPHSRIINLLVTRY